MIDSCLTGKRPDIFRSKLATSIERVYASEFYVLRPSLILISPLSLSMPFPSKKKRDSYSYVWGHMGNDSTFLRVFSGSFLSIMTTYVAQTDPSRTAGVVTKR